MWLFKVHEYDHGGQILRWTFLFAAPIIFEEYDQTDFSFMQLFVGVLVLILSTSLADALTFITRKDVSNDSDWEIYGRLISFAAVITYNIMVATQIWTGYIVSKLVMTIFSQQNSLLVFSVFAVSLIFLLAVVKSTTCPVQDLR